MSIQKSTDDLGVKYLVRWRSPSGVHRSRTFRHGDGKRTAKQLADAFHDEVRTAARHGALKGLEIPHKTVSDVANEWAMQAEITAKTADGYAWLYNHLIAPTFEDTLLSTVTVQDVEQWLSRLETGPHAKRKAAALLSQLFNHARRWGYIQHNPVELAKRPKVPAKKARTAPSPLEVERVRQELLGRDRYGDAILVAVLAYAGLRPQEALALDWADIRERTIHVYAPKTGSSRAVRILAPLRRDLNEWRLATTSSLVFPDRRGQEWSPAAWGSWVGRVWRGTKENPGVAHGAWGYFHPYLLRHTFVSLLIASGMSVVEVAAQAGHSPQVCLSTYSHLFSEGVKGDAEDVIRAARAEIFGERKAS